MNGIFIFHGIPTDSNGIQRNLLEFNWNVLSFGIPWNLVGIPVDSNGNCSGRLLDSGGFWWIPTDSIGISMELETKMAEAPANWFLSEFHGIPWNSDIPLGIRWNPPEVMGESKDLPLHIVILCLTLFFINRHLTLSVVLENVTYF